MTPIVVFVFGPHLPPGHGTDEASGQVVDNTVLLAVATPIAAGVLVFIGYSLWAFREREPELQADGPALRGQLERAVLVDRRDDHGGALALRVRDHPAARRRRRRRPGTRTDRGAALTPPGTAAAGAGDRPAVAVHLPLALLRRRRDARIRAAGQHAGRVQRHLARRDPLLLGLPARRQGRREPGREQHRVRDDQGPARLQASAAPSCAASGTATCSTAGGSCRARASPRGSRSSSVQYAPATRNLPPYSKTYFPEPQRRGG